MLRLPIGLICLLLATLVCAVFAADDTTYTAVVVEFDDNVVGESVAARLNARQDKIVAIIAAPEYAAADIIIFPEYALKEIQPQVVSNPADNIVLCTNDTYAGTLVAISCAARAAATYVVLNVLTRHVCSEEKPISDTRDCSSDDSMVYNSNVVFDRSGAVISIYHKFHTYNEPLNTTFEVESVFFETDFGVKFGHLICFDILFEEPAASLLKQGVTNFVFPSEWVSELPFLTATQIQQGWAQSLGVNLLAAGISNPASGSTGTGIYSGAQGALSRHFSGSRATVALSSSVSKEPGQNVVNAQLSIPAVSPPVFLLRDHIANYTIEALVASEDEIQTELCYEGFCCIFDYHLMDAGETQQTSYEYVAGVYSGYRPFGPQKDLLKVAACAVFACTDATNLESCATLSTAFTISNRYQFQKLIITGQFQFERAFVMPNSLTIGLVPMLTANYEFVTTDPDEPELHEYKNVSMSLAVFDQHLMTFGIWGREFSSASRTTLATVVLLMATLILNLV